MLSTFRPVCLSMLVFNRLSISFEEWTIREATQRHKPASGWMILVVEEAILMAA
jgi:hypothetical protein